MPPLLTDSSQQELGKDSRWLEWVRVHAKRKRARTRFRTSGSARAAGEIVGASCEVSSFAGLFSWPLVSILPQVLVQVTGERRADSGPRRLYSCNKPRTRGDLAETGARTFIVISSPLRLFRKSDRLVRHEKRVQQCTRVTAAPQRVSDRPRRGNSVSLDRPQLQAPHNDSHDPSRA